MVREREEIAAANATHDQLIAQTDALEEKLRTSQESEQTANARVHVSRNLFFIPLGDVYEGYYYGGYLDIRALRHRIGPY